MRRLLQFAFLLLLPLGLAAETVAPFVIPSARLNGMGGRHAALADDFSSLFSNPAGFVGVREELSVAELTVSAYGPIFDIVDASQDFLGGDGTLDLSPIVGPGGFAAGVDAAGPLSFGWVGRSLGFGFFNRTRVDSSAKGLTLSATASEEFLVTGGYAFRFLNRDGHVMDAGFLGKGFIRGSLALQSSILTVTDLFDGNPLETQPFNTVAGVGADLGILYRFAQTYSAGLVFRDAYSPALKTVYGSASDFFNGAEGDGSYVTVRPSLDVGFAYQPRIPVLDRYLSRFSLLLDYKDVLGFMDLIPRNPILNLGIGAEVVVLDALSLRAGIADAAPSLGFGIDFSFMQLDFAMRGVELGLDPGAQTTYAIDLGLLFRY